MEDIRSIFFNNEQEFKEITIDGNNYYLKKLTLADAWKISQGEEEYKIVMHIIAGIYKNKNEPLFTIADRDALQDSSNGGLILQLYYELQDFNSFDEKKNTETE